MENKKHLGIIDQFLIATTEWKSYVSLTEQKTSAVVRYILLIALLITTITTAIPAAGYVTSIGGYEKFFNETFPQFEYRDGILTMERKVTMDVFGVPITIDSSIEKPKASDMDGSYLQQFFITKTDLFVYQNKQGYQIKLDKISKDRITNKTLADNEMFFNTVTVLYVVICFFMELGMYILGALFFAFVGLNIAGQRKIKLSFPQVFKIAIYARTGASIIGAVYGVIGKNSLGMTWLFISMAITFVFMTFGIMAHGNKKEDV